MTWKPNFNSSTNNGNPYAGMPDDYLEKIKGTKALESAVSKGWINVPSTISAITPTNQGTQTDFKPNFNLSDPYQGVTADYLLKEKESFVPTIDNPLPPSQSSQTGISTAKITGISYEPLAIPDNAVDLDKIQTQDVWKPNFNSDTPWAGMPDNYAGKETFVATVSTSLPPWTGQIAYKSKAQDLVNEFDSKWGNYIDGDKFTGSEEQYNEMSKDYEELNKVMESDKTLIYDPFGNKITAPTTKQEADDLKKEWTKIAYQNLQKDNVQISGGWVDKEFYDSLPKEYQDILREQGSDWFNYRVQSDKKYADLQEGIINATNVKLGDGSYMPKNSKYDEDGNITVVGFNDLDKKWQDIALSDKGYEGMLDAMEQERIDNINTVNNRIEELKTTKADTSNISLGDKIQDIAKEALSIGITQTQTFNDNDIRLEYLNERKSALEEGIDLPYTEDEYVNMVMDKQDTLADLGMLLVPFEYVRPERWNELQGWEKVVYPALDIITLIPVVGLAGKGVSALTKAVSTSAKVASLGGIEAVKFATADAVKQVSVASTKTIAKQALVESIKDAIPKAVTSYEKNILQNAYKYAVKDVKLAEKELKQISKNANDLEKLLEKVDKVKLSDTATQVYKTASKIERVGGRASVATSRLADTMVGGVISGATIQNWDELSNSQRVAGLALAALPLGIYGKIRNITENIIDPYKVPFKSVGQRVASSKIVAGKIFAEEGGKAGGTTRLVIDFSVPPEEAREAMASLMRQLHETGGEATVEYAGKILKLKGTGFQSAVGGNVAFSASPFGDIFKEGTGAFGKKTNLEQYLESINKNLPESQKIEIESQPYKVIDEVTGKEKEVTISTISSPGVIIQGKEGGQYYGQTLYNKFSRQPATSGVGKGEIVSGIITHTGEISGLPKALASKDIDAMKHLAYEYFDGSRNINEIVEGFKRYKIFAEAENVITNGSQLQRTQNLRSKLSDKLKLNRGEYYTRDKNGRIELFQMYLEGGRTTPYTLKELYQLKGNALKNALEDMIDGLKIRVDELTENIKFGRTKDATELLTKEEQIAKALSYIDDINKKGLLTDEDAVKAKRTVLDKFNEERARVRPDVRDNLNIGLGIFADTLEREDRSDREAYRNTIDREDYIRSDIDRERQDREESRIDEIDRVESSRTEEPRVESARIETPRTDVTRTEIPRTEIPRVDAPRVDVPRVTIPRVDVPRVDIPRVDKPPIETRTEITLPVEGEKRYIDVNIKPGSIAWKQGFAYKLLQDPYRDIQSFPDPPVGFMNADDSGEGVAYRNTIDREDYIRSDIDRERQDREESRIDEIDRVESSRTEEPRVESARIETPRTDVTRTEIPRTEIPRVDAPRVDVPRVTIPRVDVPRVDIPRVDKPPIETRTEITLPVEGEKRYIDVNIKPGSIAWKQGFAYKLLQDPYRDIQSFPDPPVGFMNADDSGEGVAYRTLQFIGGAPLWHERIVNLGWADVKVVNKGGKPEIEYLQGDTANTGLQALRYKKQRELDKQKNMSQLVYTNDIILSNKAYKTKKSKNTKKQKAFNNEFIYIPRS